MAGDEGWDDDGWDVLVEHDCGLGAVLAEREPSRQITSREPSRPMPVPPAEPSAFVINACPAGRSSRPISPSAAMAEADFRAAQLTAKLRGPRKMDALPEAVLECQEGFFRPELEVTEEGAIVGYRTTDSAEAEVSGEDAFSAEPVFKIMVFEHLSLAEDAHPYSVAARERGEVPYKGIAFANLGETGDEFLDGGVFPNILCWSTCHACLKGELQVPGEPSEADRLMAQALSRPDPCPNHPPGERNVNCSMCQQWHKCRAAGAALHNHNASRPPDEPCSPPPREETTTSSMGDVF